jgi:hypothetical protein
VVAAFQARERIAGEISTLVSSVARIHPGTSPSPAPTRSRGYPRQPRFRARSRGEIEETILRLG